jgi:YaiO family outer membrane protein
MKQYDSAYYYQQFREIDDLFERQKWSLTLEKLRAEKLKNQLAATYTQANSDSTAFSTSLASISYNHRYDKKNTFGADVNYAARRSGVGVQAGVNYSRIFNPTLYADAGVLFGSQFFPKVILYGNAYKGLKNGYEVQAGVRYMFLQNEVNFISLNLGGAKTWEDIWLGVKLSLMRDDKFNYFNFVSQSRINVNTRGDYVSFLVSFGSAPFNEQFPEEAAAFLDFSNVLVGVGYGYNLSPKTKLLVNGSWTNFKSPITDSTSLFFINQYNLSVSIITKF